MPESPLDPPETTVHLRPHHAPEGGEAVLPPGGTQADAGAVDGLSNSGRIWLAAGAVAVVLALVVGGLSLLAAQELRSGATRSSPTAVETSTSAPTSTTPVTTETVTTLPPPPVVTGAPPPAAVSASPAAPATSAPGRYQTRTNARYGFSCDVPADYSLVGPPPQNGDGFTYKRTAGYATVTCSGSNNSGTASAKAEFEEELAGRRGSGSTVTYSALIGNAVTISGVNGSNIFYDRILWGPGSINSMRWEYSQALDEDVKNHVVHSARAMRSGDLSIPH